MQNLGLNIPAVIGLVVFVGTMVVNFFFKIDNWVLLGLLASSIILSLIGIYLQRRSKGRS
ncbi:MAG: hypothetical protein LBU61_03670 [Coriobacteriales bacterium]|jgi:uncharacterized membrane protein|nr:hypothetical protein [Coriobacteriales bacterium]